MWEIDWAGDRFTGLTAEAVLDAIAAAQWDPTTNIRKTISNRLWMLDRLIVDDELPPGDFLRTLHDLGILQIITPV